MSSEADEIYKKLLAVYVEKGFINPQGVLDSIIKTHVDQGKTRGEAILCLWEKENVRTPTQPDNEQIEQFKEKIKSLAGLFSKGEITEETYKTSVKAIEENIGRLRRGEKIPTVKEEPRLPSIPLEEARARGWAKRPSAWWWLVPFLFGLLGAIVAYLGVKDDDPDMAKGLLVFGIIWSLVLGFIGYALLVSVLRR
jgi:hypothetical protein